MSPDPSVRDRSESVDGREEEDDDEEMDEYEIFALPTQYREKPLSKPMTPLQLLNSSRPKVLASAFPVEQPQLRTQYQSPQQCHHHSIAVPSAGFHALYPHLQFEHQLQQPTICALPIYHQNNSVQFFSPDIQLQPPQHYISAYASTHDSTLSFSSHDFLNHAQDYRGELSTRLLTALEHETQQQHLDARPTPQNTVPSLEQSLDMLMTPQFAGNLDCNDLLVASSTSSMVHSPSLSWASITPSRDSSPSLSKEHVALADSTGKRMAGRLNKKRSGSGSSFSRHGSKASKTKSVSLLGPSSASDSSVSAADSTHVPSAPAEGTISSTQYQAPTNIEVPMKRRRRMRQMRIKAKPTSFGCDAPGCGKIFSRAYNLTSHMKTHSAERPFVCGSCPLAFARRHDRERHVRLHTGEKPYTCESCGCGFMRNDALHRHHRICGQSASALLALMQQQQQQENAPGYEDLF
ncbi:hypothetical protein BGZ72_003526 [Mortierella alpina]|nr:hypothetical protein BGZ72_003526 [Mortierella alpina]